MKLILLGVIIGALLPVVLSVGGKFVDRRRERAARERYLRRRWPSSRTDDRG
jgi:hypothetical protein